MEHLAGQMRPLADVLDITDKKKKKKTRSGTEHTCTYTLVQGCYKPLSICQWYTVGWAYTPLQITILQDFRTEKKGEGYTRVGLSRVHTTDFSAYSFSAYSFSADSANEI